MSRNLLLFLYLFLAVHLKAQGVWHLIKDKNNIQVYTSDADASRFKHVKVVGVFDGTLEKLTAIFSDVDKQKEWVYGTRRSYLIKKVSDNEILYYVETALPLVSNRDIAIRMKINENKTNKIVRITTVGEPDAIPLNAGKVRVPRFTGDWEVRPAGKNNLSITYFLFVDPGGSLPSWIINMFIGKGPYETFKKLGELLKKT